MDMVTGGMLALPGTPEDRGRPRGEGRGCAGGAVRDRNVVPAPPLPFVPSELIGTPPLLAMLVHAGSLDDGVQAVALLRTLAQPVADVRPVPFSEMFAAEAPDVPPRSVVGTFFSDSLDEAGGTSGAGSARAALLELRLDRHLMASSRR